MDLHPKIRKQYSSSLLTLYNNADLLKPCMEKLAYVDFDNDFSKLPGLSRSCQLLRIKHPLTVIWQVFILSPNNPVKGLFNHM